MAEHGSVDLIIKAHYRGGDFDQGVSPLYDGAKSLEGFARFLQINIHALLNEEVLKRATALKGARVYRKASKEGSFVEVIQIVIDNPIYGTVVAPAIYDLLKYTASRVVGKKVVPETSAVKKLVDRKEPFISQLCSNLDGPVKDMHRPITMDREVTLDIERPRSSLVRFDRATNNFLNKETESSLQMNMQCNITKMNALSEYGRLHLDEINKTVAYQVKGNVSFAEGLIINQSLYDYKHGEGGKILIDGVKILDREGTVQRVIIHAVRNI